MAKRKKREIHTSPIAEVQSPGARYCSLAVIVAGILLAAYLALHAHLIRELMRVVFGS
jgi:hypothetical protein